MIQSAATMARPITTTVTNDPLMRRIDPPLLSPSMVGDPSVVTEPSLLKWFFAARRTSLSRAASHDHTEESRHAPSTEDTGGYGVALSARSRARAGSMPELAPPPPRC